VIFLNLRQTVWDIQAKGNIRPIHNQRIGTALEQSHVPLLLEITPPVSRALPPQTVASDAMNRSMKVTFVLISVLGAFTAVIDASEKVTTGTPSAKPSELIAMTLRECADWTHVSPVNVRERKRITDTYLRLARFSNQDLRSGISLFLNSYPRRNTSYVEASEKVFALLRVVFDVPLKLDAQNGQLYQQWGNPIVGPGERDFLWPFTVDDHGHLHLTAATAATYLGAPPDVSREFDVMARTLQRRFPSDG
jgi:hypothetical protein